MSPRRLRAYSVDLDDCEMQGDGKRSNWSPEVSVLSVNIVTRGHEVGARRTYTVFQCVVGWGGLWINGACCSIQGMFLPCRASMTL
jgi:hypothetical protein